MFSTSLSEEHRETWGGHGAWQRRLIRSFTFRPRDGGFAVYEKAACFRDRPGLEASVFAHEMSCCECIRKKNWFRIKQTAPNVNTITDIGISFITEVAHSRLELSRLSRQIKRRGLTAYARNGDCYFCSLVAFQQIWEKHLKGLSRLWLLFQLWALQIRCPFQNNTF